MCPFNKYPTLFNFAWSFHFYFYGLGIFLLSFYCLLRFFFTSRLAILGVFAVISSWSFSRVLSADFLSCFVNTYPLLFVWSFLWSTKSSTYRSGLLTGLVCAMGAMINVAYSLLFPVMLVGVPFIFSKEKTKWYKRQWLKYNALGAVIIFSVLLTHSKALLFLTLSRQKKSSLLSGTLSTVRPSLLWALLARPSSPFTILANLGRRFSLLTLDHQKVAEFGYCLMALFALSFLISPILP